MTWRISEVGLYRKRTKELRALKFKPAGLNIISGESARGKSALLAIVDYCLLSRRCNIPHGDIRRVVSHVGMVMSNDEEKFVIVRPIPPPGRATTSEAYVRQGPRETLPETVPEMTWNLETARTALNNFTGIEELPVLQNYSSDDSEKDYAASIRHCACYLEQPQDVIANRNVLFPGLDDSWYKRHVSDALNYFLGIVSVEKLKKVRELRTLTLKRNALRRQREEQRRLKEHSLGAGRDLYLEASAMGLVSVREAIPEAEVSQELARIPSIAPANPLEFQEGSALAELEKQEAKLRSRQRSLRDEIAEVDRVLRDEQSHADITETQLGKLRLRDLVVPGDETHACPVCGSDRLAISDIEETLASSIQVLEAVRTPPRALRAQLERRRASAIAALGEVQGRLDDARGRLKTAIQELDADRRLIEEARRRERLVGRIQQYLAAMSSEVPGVDESDLIDAKIKELEQEVGEAAIERATNEARRQIGARMTMLSRELNMEFAGNRCELDFENLTVNVWIDQEDNKPARLSEIGSAASWVGYHLLACIALHEYFAEHESSVPRVLLLDQPSQVWFPATTAELTGMTVPERDADVLAIQHVYELLYNRSHDKYGPQVIVVDHAKLPLDIFRESTVEEWRGEGNLAYLVPKNWWED